MKQNFPCDWHRRRRGTVMTLPSRGPRYHDPRFKNNMPVSPLICHLGCCFSPNLTVFRTELKQTRHICSSDCFPSTRINWTTRRHWWVFRCTNNTRAHVWAGWRLILSQSFNGNEGLSHFLSPHPQRSRINGSLVLFLTFLSPGKVVFASSAVTPPPLLPL